MLVVPHDAPRGRGYGLQPVINSILIFILEATENFILNIDVK